MAASLYVSHVAATLARRWPDVRLGYGYRHAAGMIAPVLTTRRLLVLAVLLSIDTRGKAMANGRCVILAAANGAHDLG